MRFSGAGPFAFDQPKRDSIGERRAFCWRSRQFDGGSFFAFCNRSMESALPAPFDCCNHREIRKAIRKIVLASTCSGFGWRGNCDRSWLASVLHQSTGKSFCSSGHSKFRIVWPEKSQSLVSRQSPISRPCHGNWRRRRNAPVLRCDWVSAPRGVGASWFSFSRGNCRNGRRFQTCLMTDCSATLMGFLDCPVHEIDRGLGVSLVLLIEMIHRCLV